MGLRIYRISQVIYYFFYLNVLWCFFTLVGGIFLGVFPATLAVYTLLRQQLITGEWSVTFREFWQIYRANFRCMLKPAVVIEAVGFLLWLNYHEVPSLFPEALLAYYLLLLVGVLFVAYCLIFFPVHAHFKLSFKEGLVQPFYVMMANPLLAVASIVMFVVSELAVIYTSGIYLLFFISIPGYCCMGLYRGYFEKLTGAGDLSE